MRAENYFLGCENRASNFIPAKANLDGHRITVLPGMNELLGVLIRVDATPDVDKIIVESHGELIDGEWVEVIDVQQVPEEIETETKLSRTVFNFREVVDACDSVDKTNGNSNLRTKLDTIMDNRDMQYHLIGAGGVVDLNDEVTIRGMTDFSDVENPVPVFTPNEFQSILLAI